MKRKNIVISPCGNRSVLFRDAWMKDEADREFDICLLFYHDTIEHPERYEKVDYFYHLKDFKYFMLHKLFQDIHPEWLEEYEYFYFPDDDIEINTRDINKLFALSKGLETSISQASLSVDSFCSWPMFRHHNNCMLRYVGQIEVMAPLFSREALKTCLPSFIGNRSSWGIDSVWSRLLNYPEDKLVVFDAVVMKHTLPVGGGELYTKLGVSPHEEWKAVTQQFDARLHNYHEYGRLRLLHRKKNFGYKIVNAVNEEIISIRRKIKDYDINSRIRNKWKNLTA